MPQRALSAPWRLATQVRAALYRSGVLRQHRLELPTISVGALEMGGTGKTPAVAMLATMLRDAGWHPAILSRGYARQGTAPRLVSAGAGLRLPAREAGDEPAWYARSLPGVMVAVAGPREQAAGLACDSGQPTLFLLDDAFQHLRVARDLNLLMVDGSRPFYDSLPPPVGRLREGPEAASRANAFLVLGANSAVTADLHGRYPGRPTFGLEPEPPAAIPLDSYLGPGGSEPSRQALPERVLAFAAIARPERFWAQAQDAGLGLTATCGFRDHHWYTSDDIERLARRASDDGATALLTTEKDAVRLADLSRPSVPVFVWRYRLRPRDPERLSGWLRQRLGIAPQVDR